MQGGGERAAAVVGAWGGRVAAAVVAHLVNAEATDSEATATSAVQERVVVPVVMITAAACLSFEPSTR